MPGNAGPPSNIIGDEEIPGEAFIVCVYFLTNVQVYLCGPGKTFLIQASKTPHSWLICNLFPLEPAGLPGGSAGKESSCNVGDLGWEDPLEKRRLPTPVFWPGEFYGL